MADTVCCYCPYINSNNSSTSSSNNSSDDTAYMSEANYQDEKKSLQRSVAHVKVDDIAQNELIEELQKRLRESQLCIQDLIDVANDLKSRVTELQGYMSRSTYDRDHFVSSGIVSLSKSITHSMTTWFTPFETYRSYLLGDYENQTDTKGYQTDTEILNKTNVKPDAMLSYLPSPEEDDRLQDRIKVVHMFLNIGNESGSAESDMSEYTEMLNDPSTSAAAVEALRRIYEENTTGSSDSSVDS